MAARYRIMSLSSGTDLQGGLRSCISPLLAWQVSEGQGFVLPWQQLIASVPPEAAQGAAGSAGTLSGYDVIPVAREMHNLAPG